MTQESGSSKSTGKMRRYDTGKTDKQITQEALNRRLRANQPVRQSHQPYKPPAGKPADKGYAKTMLDEIKGSIK